MGPGELYTLLTSDAKRSQCATISSLGGGKDFSGMPAQAPKQGGNLGDISQKFGRGQDSEYPPPDILPKIVSYFCAFQWL